MTTAVFLADLDPDRLARQTAPRPTHEGDTDGAPAAGRR